MVAAVVWFGCALIFWALQPLTDSVPVGVDHTLKIPVSVSVSVDCNGLFDSAARDDSPLPVLKVQPGGSPALAFQRDPCVVVHEHARIIFAVDTAFFVAVMGCLGWFTLRGRRSSLSQLGTDPSLVGMPVG